MENVRRPDKMPTTGTTLGDLAVAVGAVAVIAVVASKLKWLKF